VNIGRVRPGPGFVLFGGEDGAPDILKCSLFFLNIETRIINLFLILMILCFAEHMIQVVRGLSPFHEGGGVNVVG